MNLYGLVSENNTSGNNTQGNNMPIDDSDDNDNSSIDTGVIDSDSVTLLWTPPTKNADGTPQTDDLAGYIVYYGQESDDYTETVDIGNNTAVSISNLTSGTWCFAVSAYDNAGNESEVSAEICKTLSLI